MTLPSDATFIATPPAPVQGTQHVPAGSPHPDGVVRLVTHERLACSARRAQARAAGMPPVGRTFTARSADAGTSSGSPHRRCSFQLNATTSRIALRFFGRWRRPCRRRGRRRYPRGVGRDGPQLPAGGHVPDSAFLRLSGAGRIERLAVGGIGEHRDRAAVAEARRPDPGARPGRHAVRGGRAAARLAAARGDDGPAKRGGVQTVAVPGPVSRGIEPHPPSGGGRSRPCRPTAAALPE